MADPKLINKVYFHEGSCSCRACGLEWKSHTLEPCPRCNALELHAEAVKLQETVEEYDQSFELYDSAVRRGSIHWKNAPGHPEKIWPDTAELVAWMANEIDRLQERLERFERGWLHALMVETPPVNLEEAERWIATYVASLEDADDPTVPQQHPDNGGVT